MDLVSLFDAAAKPAVWCHVVQANASGLWRPPAVMLQQMVLLLAVPLHGLPCNPLSEKACLDKVKCHLAALTLLQPGEYLASQGDDLQGRWEQPAC
jgi:hypothetical protein